ncbi:MAG TPA: 3-oxoacyl-[acyl-carrier-protein] synthase III C-terminal domain-containing protein, partial [Gemmataceae bacterium]|nr:3-oxoacyl-[acyl-carrier-protein] synthase III C-terminal domain-containing protein [Gemmataceae bacterium]
MNPFTQQDWIVRIFGRLNEVQANLGHEPTPGVDANVRFADLLDSMGMVELLALLAEDCGVKPEAIEQAAKRRFGTIAELAQGLDTAGLAPLAPAAQQASSPQSQTVTANWLLATAVKLPEAVQPASAINEALQRPPHWLEEHAGILQRRIWKDQDPLTAAVQAGQECLKRAGLAPQDVGTLLVTSEAPPLLIGVAAALHDRLELTADAVAMEIGGACTGFLSALWVAQSLLPQRRLVMVIAIEAVTRYLLLQPGPPGEAAALFGDAAAACLLGEAPAGASAVPLRKVVLGCDGSGASLLRVEHDPQRAFALHMRGMELAGRAVNAMAQAVHGLLHDYCLKVDDLAAVIAHGGNGRMPSLLARKLGLPPERVWSETETTGNLGSASLPVAWAARESRPPGPVI